MPARKIKKKEKASKPFLKVRSAAFTALERVVKKESFNDLKCLANLNHGGTLEVYHSLYNKYYPKRLYFSYKDMIAHSQLARLDFHAVCWSSFKAIINHFWWYCRTCNGNLKNLRKTRRLNLENLDLSSSFQKLPNHGFQERLYQR